MRARMRLSLACAALILGTAGAAGADDAVDQTLENLRYRELTRKSWTQVVDYLNNDALVVRARAARALGRLADPASVPRLVEALKVEAEPEVRRWLLFALGQIEEAAEQLSTFVSRKPPFTFETHPYIIKSGLKKGDPAFDREAARAVQALGKVAKPAQLLVLRHALTHHDPEVRGCAALAIALVYRRHEDAAQEKASEAAEAALFQEARGEESAEVRWRVSYALACLAERKPTRGPLEDSLAIFLDEGEDERGQAFAARGLAFIAIKTTAKARTRTRERDAKKDKLGQDPQLRPPAGLLKERRWPWRVAVEALPAIAAYPGDLFWMKLCRFTEHPSFHVRRKAASLIGVEGARRQLTPELFEHGIARLTKLLEDPWETVRGEALVALTEIRVSQKRAGAMKELIGRFSKEGLTARRYAVRALAKLNELGELEPLFKALERDDDHRVQLEVIERFASKPGEAGYALACSTLAKPHSSIVGAAILVLAKRKEKGVVAALIFAYEHSKNDPSRYELREMACEALCEQGQRLTEEGEPTAEIVAKLKSIAATDPSASVRAKAADALKELTGERPELEAPDADDRRPKQPKPPEDLWLRFETSRGSFDVELFAAIAPEHVRNIYYLLQQKPSFYDGKTWHRVVSHFVIQGGCPNGDGWGEPGWTLPDERSDLRYQRGTLGMPRAGADTGGCQLFFCHGPTPHLDGRYTIFGRARRGLEVIDRLEEGDLILKVRVLGGKGDER